MSQTRRAFTLVELIVVIAIVAILAALIFPVFVRAKKQAKVTTCVGNLSQIYHAVAMYAGDNDDWVPPYGTSDSPISMNGNHFQGNPRMWKLSLEAYKASERQFWCPLDPHKGKEFFGFMEPTTSVRWKETSYMLNPTFYPSVFGSTDGAFRLSLTSLPDKWKLTPSETVYISDVMWGDETAPPGVNRLVGNHDGRVFNVAYLDGHIRAGPAEKL